MGDVFELSEPFSKRQKLDDPQSDHNYDPLLTFRPLNDTLIHGHVKILHAIKNSEIEDPTIKSPENLTPDPNFEINSPRVVIPELFDSETNSPKINSPKAKSPKTGSPKIDSPKTESPKIDSPKPNRSDPQVSSPVYCIPSLLNNTLATSLLEKHTGSPTIRSFLEENKTIKTEVIDRDYDSGSTSESADHNLLVNQLMDIIKPGTVSDDRKNAQQAGYDISQLDLSVESLQSICLSLARLKHDNESKDIKMELSDVALWSEFHEAGNEMIITRSGRRMFPKLDVTVTGLKPDVSYLLLVDITPCDSKRYRYCNSRSKWVEIGSSKHGLMKQIFIHPEGPKPGKHWMSGPVSFQKVKIQIASNYIDHINHILLESQRKYQPRVHVVQCDATFRVPMCPFKTFSFPETQFYACTTYQSAKITEMKITNNPFAKGFRNPGTATQAASDRHGARATTNMIIELSEFGKPPFLAAGGSIKLAGVPVPKKSTMHFS